MKRIDRKSAFGPTPERFARRVTHALEQEDMPMKRKLIPSALAAIVLALALTCTALAALHQQGLLDMLWHYDHKDNDGAASLIQTQIAQTGGETDIATFAIREATYIGNMVHFTVAITPKEEGVSLIYESDRMYDIELEDALQYGETLWGVECYDDLTEVFSHSIATAREGASVLLTFSISLLSEHMPDTLPISLQCLTIPPDAWLPTESETPLSFVVTREANISEVSLDIDADMDFITLKHVSLAYSPIELSVVFTCEMGPDGDYTAFQLIDENGFLMSQGGGASGFRTDGLYHSEGLYTAPAEMPKTLRVWVADFMGAAATNRVAEIDLETGDTAVYPARVYDNPELGRQILVDKP